MARTTPARLTRLAAAPILVGALLAVATPATSAPAASAPYLALAPAGSGDGAADRSAGVTITRLEVLNAPVYGGDIELAVETDRPSAAGSIELGARACPLVCPSVPLGVSNREGVLTVPTSTSPLVPRTFTLTAKVTKSDGSTATRSIVVTVADVPTELQFGTTRLAPGDPLVVTVGTARATRVEPTGTVTLTLSNGTPLDEQPIGPDRTASFTLAEGAGTVRASYRGDGAWAGDQVTADVTVARSTVTAAGRLSDDDGTVVQGEPVTLDVTLAGSLPQVRLQGTATLVARAADGTETTLAQGGFDGPGPYRYDLASFARGHLGRFELVYSTSGNARLAESRTVLGSLTVTAEPDEPSPSRTTAEATVSRRGQVTVRGAVTSSPVAGGQAQVREGRRVLATATLDGAARYRVRLPRLAPGRHDLVVVYAGDAEVAPSADRVRLRVPRR